MTRMPFQANHIDMEAARQIVSTDCDGGRDGASVGLGTPSSGVRTDPTAGFFLSGCPRRCTWHLICSGTASGKIGPMPY